MIPKTYVLANIKKLDTLYNKTNSAKEGLFYSKLAILELCGWIEETMDSIVRMLSHRKIKDKSIHNAIEDRVIKRNYGFEYQKHFKDMLVNVIGEFGVGKIEKRIDRTKLTKLEITLHKLYNYRNIEAHTHIKGITKQIDAPSLTLANFYVVYDGLKEYERALKLTGY